jgi:hypothetical protein
MVAFTASSVLTASNLNAAFNQLTINAQTGTTYTFILTDQGGLVTASNASASTYTVPANATVAYATGTRIELLNIGAGAVTLSPAAGVTLTGTTTVLQNGRVFLVKQATNTWYINACGTGGMTFITSGSFTTSTAVNVNNCFNANYAAYVIQLLITAASADLTLDMRLRASGVDAATAYEWIGVESQQAAGPTRSSGTAATVATVGSIPTDGSLVTINIGNPFAASATYGNMFVGNGKYMKTVGFHHTTASSYDGFSLIPQANNITGIVRIYGLSNA